MTNKLALSLSAIAILAIPVGTARADLVLTNIQFQTGQGFGATTTILTYSTAQGGVEQGCFAFGGLKGAYSAVDANRCLEGQTNQVDNPAGPPKNDVVSLSSLGISSTNQIGLILNLNQISDQGLTLNNMSLTFYNASGTPIFNADLASNWCNIAALCSGTNTFLSSIQGQGGNGYVFTLTDAQRTALATAIGATPFSQIFVGAGGNFGCAPNNTANCKEANDGAESIQLANITSPIVSTTPEPSTTALMATGFIGLIGVARRRRRR